MHTLLLLFVFVHFSPLEAYVSILMNILADFINRVNSLYPEDLDNEELNSLLTTIKNQGDEIDTLRKKIDLLELSKVNKEKAVTKTTKEKKTKKVAKKE